MKAGRARVEALPPQVAQLRHPPLVGQAYLVLALTVLCEDQQTRVFPVFGPEHANPELGAPDVHWHYDLRFLTEEEARYLVRTRCREAQGVAVERLTLDIVLGTCSLLLALESEGSAELVQARCLRIQPDLADAQGRWIRFLERRYAGSCLTPEGLCPHKKLPLLSLPIRKGRGSRVCPGHGLCFDRKGRLVAHTEEELQELERPIALAAAMSGHPFDRIIP